MNTLRNTMDATERAKSEVRMQKSALLHSSFRLFTSPAFRRDLHPDLRADWQMASAEVRMWN